jgi:ABC-type oligopeptide transport system substrate-binding subunit
MKQIRWSLLATAVLASLVFSVTTQQQNVAASNEDKDKFVTNHHSHSNIFENKANEGGVTNEENSHFNFNDNTNREGGSPEERSNCNSHSIPAKGGGEGTVACPP